tara:strand:- start:10615 stop:10926 length:312 start_codon:yes stop_codon:yes gene_type:complete
MSKKTEKKEVKVLKSLMGKFHFPHRPGQTVEFDADVADEIISAGYGEEPSSKVIKLPKVTPEQKAKAAQAKADAKKAKAAQAKADADAVADADAGEDGAQVKE